MTSLHPRRIAILSVAAALLFVAPAARAQPAPGDAPAGSPDHGTPEQQMSILLDSFPKGSAPVVMEEMLRRNPFIDEAAADKGATAVRQIAESSRLYLDSAFVGAEKITDRYVRLTYVLHFERQPILLQVRFYNVAEKTWLINTWDFSVDPHRLTEAVLEVREAAKSSR